MKLVMDEKLKHRLIGVAVILSIATIFTPAIVRKSTQHIEPKVSIAVTLPPKPLLPKVTKVDEKELLESTRVAEIELPEIIEDKPLPQLAQADQFTAAEETLAMDDSGPTELISESKLADFELAKADELKPSPEAADTATQESKTVLSNQTTRDEPVIKNTDADTLEMPKARSAFKSKITPLAVVKPLAVKKIEKNPLYSIQLASFSVESNAQALVKNLKKQGYNARITKIKVASGYVYKVHVGHLKNRKDAVKLKGQLASNFQIKGFVVSTTGVS